MSCIFRRFLASVPRTSAAEAAEEILQRFSGRPVSRRRQFLDANQAQLLSLTLGRPHLVEGIDVQDRAPPDGTPLPAGYHLAYFTPTILEEELGADGSDRTVNPLPPFTRRMWAGGELEWSQNPEGMLRIGLEVEEVTKILSAVPKTMRSGHEMIVVGVEKEFRTQKGVALVDKRNWVFQKALLSRTSPPPRNTEKSLPEAVISRDFLQSEVSLFRFSALTFNGHKIHYSKEWCHEVEGHRDCVVHGPLNLINMLDLWRDSQRSSTALPRSIKYRAMSPLYAGEKYRILLHQPEDLSNDWQAEIWDSFGKLAMQGSITD